MPELDPAEVLEVRPCRWLGVPVKHIRTAGPPVWAVVLSWSECGFDDELMSHQLSLIPQAQLLCALSWGLNNYSQIAPEIERVHELEAADPRLEGERRTYWRAPWPKAESYL
jgi:hypothetical protein